MILTAVFVLKCEWIKYFFDLTQKYFILTANITWNKRKTYICIRVYICCAFTWPKKHICIKYICVYANIHLVWAGVYLHGGVYLHMCKLTFTYMQLRSHAQKYTRVQIIHICIIYTPCINQRMWTGLKRKGKHLTQSHDKDGNINRKLQPAKWRQKMPRKPPITQRLRPKKNIFMSV